MKPIEHRERIMVLGAQKINSLIHNRNGLADLINTTYVKKTVYLLDVRVARNILEFSSVVTLDGSEKLLLKLLLAQNQYNL